MSSSFSQIKDGGKGQGGWRGEKEIPLSGEGADAAGECRELFFAVGRHRHW